jgi:asparagine N-glycosylation enzyme membrane subunit Stt3
MLRLFIIVLLLQIEGAFASAVYTTIHATPEVARELIKGHYKAAEALIVQSPTNLALLVMVKIQAGEGEDAVALISDSLENSNLDLSSFNDACNVLTYEEHRPDIAINFIKKYEKRYGPLPQNLQAANAAALFANGQKMNL